MVLVAEFRVLLVSVEVEEMVGTSTPPFVIAPVPDVVTSKFLLAAGAAVIPPEVEASVSAPALVELPVFCTVKMLALVVFCFTRSALMMSTLGYEVRLSVFALLPSNVVPELKERFVPAVSEAVVEAETVVDAPSFTVTPLIIKVPGWLPFNGLLLLRASMT